MALMQAYNDALAALYEHVGFTEDYVVYAVDDKTDMFWRLRENDDEVIFAETLEALNSDGDYYSGEIYRQRFYDKWVYRGSELTMVFVDTHVDGNRFFAFFSNDKEVVVQ